MSLMIKLFCCLFVLGVAGLFVLKSPDGTPWLSINDFKPDSRSLDLSVNNLLPESVNDDSRDSVPVYKWRDAQGNWQFSDQPPKGVESELVTVDTTINRNLLPAPKQSNDILLNNSEKQSITDRGILPTTVDSSDITTLIDDTEQIQDLMDNRQNRLDSAIKKSE